MGLYERTPGAVHNSLIPLAEVNGTAPAVGRAPFNYGTSYQELSGASFILTGAVCPGRTSTPAR